MNKISKKLLLVMLVLIMLQWAGANYFYDFPQLFTAQLIQKFGITTVEVSLLYSAASAPNLVSNLIAAWIIEKIGLGISAVLFSTNVFAGIFICYIGFMNQNFKLLLIGRFIFGIGFDTTFLTQTLSCANWFNGRFMTLANSLNRSCVYLFAAVATYLQPELLYKYRSFQFPMFVYSVVAFGCFLSTALFSVIHVKNQSKLIEKNEKEGMKSKFQFRDFKHLDWMPWIIAICLALISNCYYQVMNFTTDMIMMRYGLDYIHSKNATTIIPVLSMILIPIFGFIFNKYGRKGLGMLISTSIAAGTFFIMTLIPYGCSPNYIYGFLILISLFRSIYTSCVWSCLLLSVPKQASTAFVAFGATLQNICMASFPPLFASVNKNRDYPSYQKSLYMLIGMSLFCTVLAIIINTIDLRTDKILFLPENDEKVAELKLKKIEEFSMRKKRDEIRRRESQNYKSMQSGREKSLKEKLNVLD